MDLFHRASVDAELPEDRLRRNRFVHVRPVFALVAAFAADLIARLMPGVGT